MHEVVCKETLPSTTVQKRWKSKGANLVAHEVNKKGSRHVQSMPNVFSPFFCTATAAAAEISVMHSNCMNTLQMMLCAAA